MRLCCSAGGMNWVSLMLGFFISFFMLVGLVDIFLVRSFLGLFGGAGRERVWRSYR